MIALKSQRLMQDVFRTAFAGEKKPSLCHAITYLSSVEKICLLNEKGIHARLLG